MASEQQDDEYQKFLNDQQAAEQPGSVLDRPRPFTKPPKGSQKGALIVAAVFIAVMVGLRVALWLSR
jgi:hypothetical protein